MDTIAQNGRLPRPTDLLDPENFLQRANFEDTFWDCAHAVEQSRQSAWRCWNPWTSMRAANSDDVRRFA